MTKKELTREVSYKLGINEAAILNIIDTTIKVIKENVKKGNPVTMRGFCSFGMKLRKQKIGQNINKGTSVIIPEKSVPFAKVYESF
jgi:DNA-binding protein HU-beta